MDIIKIHLYTVTAALPSVMVCHTYISHIHSIVLYIVECKCTVNVACTCSCHFSSCMYVICFCHNPVCFGLNAD